MPLGDSITQGFADSGSGYRDPLYTDLSAAKIPFKFTGAVNSQASSQLTNAGQNYHNGYSVYTIQNLRDNLDGAFQPNPGAANGGGYWITGGNGTGRAAAYPQIVLLEAGTNDINQGLSLASVQSRMTNVLTWFATNRPNTQVIVSLVTPYNDAQTGTTGKNALVQQFNSWLVQTVPTYGVNFSLVDNYSLFIDSAGAIKTSSSPDGIYLQDGIHPSHAGYAAMGDNWYRAIRPVLTQLDFVGADIGTVGVAGSSAASSGVYTLQGAGAGISGTADACQFDFKTVTGDCSLIARVVSLTNPTNLAQAGIMIRDTASVGAKQVCALLTPQGGVRFNSRSSPDASATTTTSAGPAAPYWLRVTRSGNTFTAYSSADGSVANPVWTTLGTATITMAHQVQIGLVVASGNTSELCTALFDNVSTPLGLRRIMPLGDSITKGATDSGSGYRDQVFTDLNGSSLPFNFLGQTTTNASSQLTNASQQFHNGYGTYAAINLFNNLTGNSQPGGGADANQGGYWMTSGTAGGADVNPDIVLLHAGTNDIFLNYDLAGMESNMTQLMSWFRVNRPYAKVVVAKIVPRLDSTARNQQTIDFNAWLGTVVPTYGANFSLVDMYPLFVDGHGSIKTSSSPDGIFLNDNYHPNHAGYVAMGNVWFDAILNILFPIVPNGLIANAGNGAVQLSWSPVPGASGYNVKRASASGGPYTTFASNLSAASYNDTTVSNFSTYYYVVSSLVSAVGESTNSLQVTASPFGFPPAPAGLTAAAGTSFIQLDWSAATAATSYNIKRATASGGPYTTIASAFTGTSFTDSSAQLAVNTPYYYVVTAANSVGEGTASDQATATMTSTNASLPSPWLAKNIGGVTVAGTTTVSNGTFTVTGGGAAINLKADSFYYVYQPVSGDCTIITRVVSQQNTSQFAQCGLMMRQSLNADSAHFMAAMTPGKGIGYYVRSSTGATMSYTYPNTLTTPYYLRIVRTGNKLVASTSPNGTTWATLATVSLNWRTWIYVGLPVASVSNTSTCQVVLDNVSVSSTGQPAVPTGVTATPGSASIVLNWSAASGASSYKVKRSTSAAGPFTILASGLTATTYTDTTASIGTTYYYGVSAVTTGGESSDSPPVNAIIPTPLMSWRQTYFGTTASTGNAADLADPDRDGISNLLEYALNTIPTLASSMAGVTVGRTGDGARLTLTFPRIADPSLTYTVEATNDLAAGTWGTIWTGAGISGVTTVTDTVLISAQPQRYFRLRVTK